MKARTTRRVFCALWPDVSSRAALTDWVGAAHRAAGGRAVQASNLHMTLAFIGAVDEARIDELAALTAGVAFQPFDLLLDRHGCWKHIAWLGASSVPPALTDAVSTLRAALKAREVRFDPKPFVAHVTLLREALAPGAWERLAPVRWPVRRIVLAQSGRDQQGLFYRIV